MFIRKFVITIYQSLDKSVYHICIYRISKTIEVKTFLASCQVHLLIMTYVANTKTEWCSVVVEPNSS